MKRVLFFISLTLCFIVSNAQTESRQSEINALANKVDSLEHVVSYMNLHSELYSLINEMKISKNEVFNHYVDIKSDILNKNFNRKLGKSHKQYYEAVESNKKSLVKKIEAIKKLYIAKIITYPYSEAELGVLNAVYDTIDPALGSLEKSIEALKTATEIYNELM